MASWEGAHRYSLTLRVNGCMAFVWQWFDDEGKTRTSYSISRGAELIDAGNRQSLDEACGEAFEVMSSAKPTIGDFIAGRAVLDATPRLVRGGRRADGTPSADYWMQIPEQHDAGVRGSSPVVRSAGDPTGERMAPAPFPTPTPPESEQP